MARAALSSKHALGKQPPAFARLVPAASVVLASMLAVLPIVSESGWYPDFGFLVLLGWRLLRADPWPNWWAAPLGFVNDLFTGYPIGLSVALWSATMLALDLIDQRTMWRDYWIEWILAGMFIAVDEMLQWRVAKAAGAAPEFVRILPAIAVSIFAFPLVAWLVSRLDSWRLGRRRWR